MWTLIDTETPVVKEVAGVNVHVRAMTNGEKFRLAKEVERLKDKDIDGLFEAIAPYIVKIEGYEGDVVDALKKAKDPAVQSGIISAVMSVSTLNEDEVKNSQSSSVG